MITGIFDGKAVLQKPRKGMCVIHSDDIDVLVRLLAPRLNLTFSAT